MLRVSYLTDREIVDVSSISKSRLIILDGIYIDIDKHINKGIHKLKLMILSEDVVFKVQTIFIICF